MENLLICHSLVVFSTSAKFRVLYEYTEICAFSLYVDIMHLFDQHDP